MTAVPPDRVRDAFRLQGDPIRLPGGVSGVLRFDDVVPAVDGAWVFDGWIAHEFIPDLRPAFPDWRAVIEGGRRFHAVTRSLRPPTEVLAARRHRWARRERHAFDEEAVPLPPDAASIDRRLADWCTPDPDPDPDQVVHVDLLTNVFADADGIPVLLDIAPGVRSPGYPEAVAVADTMLWNDAPLAAIDRIGVARPRLARSMRFRLVTEQLARGAGNHSAHGGEVAPYERLIRELS